MKTMTTEGITPEQQLLYENQGFLHLPGVIPGDLVARVRSAFDRATEETEQQWRDEVANGRASAAYYDIPHILDRGDCFVDLVDLAPLMPILLEVVGPDLQLNH